MEYGREGYCSLPLFLSFSFIRGRERGEVSVWMFKNARPSKHFFSLSRPLQFVVWSPPPSSSLSQYISHIYSLAHLYHQHAHSSSLIPSSLSHFSLLLPFSFLLCSLNWQLHFSSFPFLSWFCHSHFSFLCSFHSKLNWIRVKK